jgi:hypothetical protein
MKRLVGADSPKSISVFDPDGPMYSPMVNPEDPALGSEDDENAALDSGGEHTQRHHLE